jgi:hypothetical protein
MEIWTVLHEPENGGVFVLMEDGWIGDRWRQIGRARFLSGRWHYVRPSFTTLAPPDLQLHMT